MLDYNEIYNNSVQTPISNNIALVTMDDECSYNDLNNEYLMNMNLKKTMRVLIFLSESDIELYRTVISLGKLCSVSILDVEYTHTEIDMYIEKSNANLIITDDNYIELLPNTHIPIVNINDPKNIDPLLHVACDSNELIGLISSGTVSNPRIIPMTRQSMNYNAFQRYQMQMHMNTDDVIVQTIPLNATWGMVIFYVSMILGCKFVAMPLTMRRFNEYANKYSPTLLFGSPLLYNNILSGDVTLINNKIREARIGGSYVSVDVKKRVFDYFELDNLWVGYGLSETGSAGFDDYQTVETIDRDSLGIINPGMEYKLNENDVILLRGGTLGSEWFNTGDIATTNDDGTLRIIGRDKNIIDLGGIKVMPNEVETVIEKLPDVVTCSVMGTAAGLVDQVEQQLVCVYVGTATTDNVREHCKNHLLAYKIPEIYISVESLLYNNSEKKDTKSMLNQYVMPYMDNHK